MKLTPFQCLLWIEPRQELNDSQSKNRRAETNKTSNNIQLILPYSGKPGKKIVKKWRSITGNLYQKTYRWQWHFKAKCKFNVKDKT